MSGGSRLLASVVKMQLNCKGYLLGRMALWKSLVRF